MALDTDADGELTSKDLDKGFRKTIGLRSKKVIDQIFELMDQDENHKITLSEFIIASIDQNAFFTRDRLKKCFLMFDTDNSGEIDLNELKDMFNSIGIPYDVWEDILMEVDEDGNGSISFEEFIEIMLAKSESQYRQVNPAFKLIQEVREKERQESMKDLMSP